MVAIGTMLGKFRVESVLGHGVTSMVFRAYDTIGNRPAAP